MQVWHLQETNYPILEQDSMFIFLPQLMYSTVSVYCFFHSTGAYNVPFWLVHSYVFPTVLEPQIWEPAPSFLDIWSTPLVSLGSVKVKRWVITHKL